MTVSMFSRPFSHMSGGVAAGGEATLSVGGELGGVAGGDGEATGAGGACTVMMAGGWATAPTVSLALGQGEQTTLRPDQSPSRLLMALGFHTPPTQLSVLPSTLLSPTAKMRPLGQRQLPPQRPAEGSLSL